MNRISIGAFQSGIVYSGAGWFFLLTSMFCYPTTSNEMYFDSVQLVFSRLHSMLAFKKLIIYLLIYIQYISF